MKLQVQVQQTWQGLSSRERKIIRAYGRGSLDAGLRVRCKIVLALVQGRSPTDIARSGMAASSLVSCAGCKVARKCRGGCKAAAEACRGLPSMPGPFVAAFQQQSFGIE